MASASSFSAAARRNAASLTAISGGSGAIEVLGLGVVILKGVGQAVSVGDEVGKGGSHHDHRRYCPGGLHSVGGGSLLPYQITTPTSTSSPAAGGRGRRT